MRNYDLELPVSLNNDAITKNLDKCISCGHCTKVCPSKVAAQQLKDVENNKDILCISCGQCTNICPVEAMQEKMAYKTVENILNNKNKQIVVFSIAPAVRVSLGEEFGLEVGKNVEKKIPTALKQMGADYVFDITFGADLTVMEEATELVTRIKKHQTMPLFSSCCPSWVKYLEVFYPELIPNLSTTKSPISMQSTIIKTLFASKIKKLPEEIIHIVVAPCTAKKSEIKREELSVTKHDCDYVLTTRELAMLLKDKKIDIKELEDSSFDTPFETGTGSGVIFGSSGGVAEATLRTAYYLLTKKNLEKLEFHDLRGMNGIKEATIKIGHRTLNVGIVNGIKNVDSLLEKIKNKECYYDFIEVMTCQGGCIAGGGQPKTTILNMQETRIKRMNALYNEDEKSRVRLCHENPNIVKVYEEYLGYPSSSMALELLHTRFEDKSYLVKGE